MEPDKTDNQWKEKLTPNEKHNIIFKESKTVPFRLCDADINEKPPWFDQQRYDRAQKIVSDVFYPCISISAFSGLLIVIQMPDILEALLKTGKSCNVTTLMNRYIDTTTHVRLWYESRNIFDPNDAGYKSIKIVRGMHKRIFRIMNNKNVEQKDDATNDETASNGSHHQSENPNAHLWVNQFDMVMTQFSFVGLILLYPYKCGAHTASDQDLLDMAYLWRILAYLMGIEDKYNLCTYDSIDEQREILALFFERLKSTLDEKRDPVGTAMGMGICYAYEALLTELSYNTLDHWWWPIVSISGSDPKPLILGDRYKTFVFSFYFNYLMKIRAFLPYITHKYKTQFDKFVAAKEKHAQVATEKYEHLTYE